MPTIMRGIGTLSLPCNIHFIKPSLPIRTQKRVKYIHGRAMSMVMPKKAPWTGLSQKNSFARNFFIAMTPERYNVSEIIARPIRKLLRKCQTLTADFLSGDKPNGRVQACSGENGTPSRRSRSLPEHLWETGTKPPLPVKPVHDRQVPFI